MVAAAAVIINIAPGSVFVEGLVVAAVTAATLLLSSFAFGNIKWGMTVTAWIVGALVLKRLGVWDWWVAGLWLVTVGLISLVN
jgi:hypothetical protein